MTASKKLIQASGGLAGRGGPGWIISIDLDIYGEAARIDETPGEDATERRVVFVRETSAVSTGEGPQFRMMTINLEDGSLSTETIDAAQSIEFGGNGYGKIYAQESEMSASQMFFAANGSFIWAPGRENTSSGSTQNPISRISTTGSVAYKSNTAGTTSNPHRIKKLINDPTNNHFFCILDYNGSDNTYVVRFNYSVSDLSSTVFVGPSGGQCDIGDVTTDGGSNYWAVGSKYDTAATNNQTIAFYKASRTTGAVSTQVHYSSSVDYISQNADHNIVYNRDTDTIFASVNMRRTTTNDYRPYLIELDPDDLSVLNSYIIPDDETLIHGIGYIENTLVAITYDNDNSTLRVRGVDMQSGEIVWYRTLTGFTSHWTSCYDDGEGQCYVAVNSTAARVFVKFDMATGSTGSFDYTNFGTTTVDINEAAAGATLTSASLTEPTLNQASTTGTSSAGWGNATAGNATYSYATPSLDEYEALN